MRIEWLSDAEANVNKEQNNRDPHPTLQSSGDPHPTAQAANYNQVSHGNTVAIASIPSKSDVPQLAGSSTEAAPNYKSFDPNGRERWGTRECADKEGCGRLFCKTYYS